MLCVEFKGVQYLDDVQCMLPVVDFSPTLRDVSRSLSSHRKDFSVCFFLPVLSAWGSVTSDGVRGCMASSCSFSNHFSFPLLRSIPIPHKGAPSHWHTTQLLSVIDTETFLCHRRHSVLCCVHGNFTESPVFYRGAPLKWDDIDSSFTKP